jgi:hypothetical protein
MTRLVSVTSMLCALLVMLSSTESAVGDVTEFINIGSPPDNLPDSARPENDCPPGSVPVETTKTILRNNTGKDASDYHFYMFQNDRPGVWLVAAGVKVKGNFTSASLESDTENNRRGDPPPGKHGARVDLAGGTVPAGGTIEVTMTLCMNERNALKLKDREWTFPEDDPEDDDGEKQAGWRVERPAPGGGGGNPGDPTGGGQGAQEDNGGMGNYFHTVCIENDDAEQSLLLEELKLLASMTAYADPPNDIDWDSIAPIQNSAAPSEPPVTISPKSAWCYAFETTGSYVGGYVYKSYSTSVVAPRGSTIIAGDPVEPEDTFGTHPVDAECSDPVCITFPPPPPGACCTGTDCDLTSGSCVEGVYQYVCDEFYSGAWLGGNSACPDGACCLPDNTCVDTNQAQCNADDGRFHSVLCDKLAAKGGCDPPIPATSEWGLAVLALVVLIAGTVVLRRRTAIA